MFALLSSVNPGVIGGLIAVILLGVLRTLTKKLLLEWNNVRYENYNRALLQEEVSWLNRSANRLSKEKSQKSYSRWTWLLTQGLLPVSIGMATTVSIAYFSLKVLNSSIDSAAISWSRVGFGVSSLFALFLGIFLAAIAMIILATRSATIRDYLTYHYGWGYMSPRPRGEEEIKVELEHHLRQGYLSTNEAYDSEVFSNLIFHRTSPFWKKGAIGVFITTVLFFILDSQSHYTVYPDRIEASPYFSIKTKTYALQDVSNVNRQCILAVKKKNPYSRFKYSIQFKDQHKIDLLTENGPEENQQLSAIETIIPMVEHSFLQPTKVKSAPILDDSPTLENCLLLLKRNKPPADVARLARIFDLPINQ